MTDTEPLSVKPQQQDPLSDANEDSVIKSPSAVAHNLSSADSELPATTHEQSMTTTTGSDTLTSLTGAPLSPPTGNSGFVACPASGAAEVLAAAAGEGASSSVTTSSSSSSSSNPSTGESVEGNKGLEGMSSSKIDGDGSDAKKDSEMKSEGREGDLEETGAGTGNNLSKVPGASSIEKLEEDLKKVAVDSKEEKMEKSFEKKKKKKKKKKYSALI
eukprot:Selendium_serpulae@DN6467_c0_g1_i4.p1